MIKSLSHTLTVYRMSKRIEIKSHMIRRQRGQRNVLRWAVSAPVKEAQANNDKGNEESAHANN